MADYAKKKNDELAALCKERGLPHTGKKADLVKRLEDHDAQDTSATAQKADGGDTIDWDEEPSTTTNAAASKPEESDAKPAGKATEVSTTAESKTEETATAEKVAPEFAGLGLQEASLDEEIAKRKKRAEKFGMDPSKDETLKLLERAKRFGTTNVPGLLNQALPEKTERNKKRGREGREDNSDRKNSRQRPNKETAKSENKPQKNGNASAGWSDADREKMEKRKARFATASS